MSIPDAGQHINFRDENGTMLTGFVVSSGTTRWRQETDEGPQDRVDHRAVVQLESGSTKEINESTEWSPVEE